MTKLKRNFICISIGMILVLLIIRLSPEVHYQARGLVLPSSKLEHQTKFNKKPYNMKLKGRINIERYYSAPPHNAQLEILDYAQRLAATVGANFFVIRSFSLEEAVRGNYIYVFQADAYYSPTDHGSLGFTYDN